MPHTKLNDATVKALAPPVSGQVTHWDATLPGFGLRIAAGGTKTWLVQYRLGGRTGKVQRLTLGRYPLLGVADARDKAKEALAAVVQGEDPAGDKRAEREAAQVGRREGGDLPGLGKGQGADRREVRRRQDVVARVGPAPAQGEVL